MPTTITRSPVFGAVQGPAAGDTVSGASLITQTIQPLANSDEYLRNILEVDGVALLQDGGTPTAIMPTRPNGSISLNAGSFQTDLWVYDAASDLDPLIGYVVKPTSVGAGLGRWVNLVNNPSRPPRLQAPRRVYVNIPISAMNERIGLTVGGSQMDGTTLALNNGGALNGVQLMTGAATGQFELRARLPKGKLMGCSLVMRPNGSGVAAPGSTAITVSTPMDLTVYSVKGASEFITASGVHTYDSASLVSSVNQVWAGSCGVIGNAFNSSSPFSEQVPKLFNFVEGTTSTSSTNTGGTAAVDVDCDREYLFRVSPPRFTGSGFSTSWPNGLQPIFYRLEAWIDVTEMGAG